MAPRPETASNCEIANWPKQTAGKRSQTLKGFPASGSLGKLVFPCPRASGREGCAQIGTQLGKYLPRLAIHPWCGMGSELERIGEMKPSSSSFASHRSQCTKREEATTVFLLSSSPSLLPISSSSSSFPSFLPFFSHICRAEGRQQVANPQKAIND